LSDDEENLDNILTKSGDSMFLKKWNRMSDYHKLQKIKEFVQEKHNSDKNIEEKLIKYLNDGLLKSCKQVQYDNIKQHITKIIISKNETY